MVIHDKWIEIPIDPAARFSTKAGQRSVGAVNPVKRRSLTRGCDSRVDTRKKTGGVAGSVGMSHAFSKPHDGYTLCGLSESNVTAGVQGGWDKKFDVWDTFIVGGSPDVISVTPDTPYKTLKDLIEAAKKNPNSIKAAASGAGSIHHLNLLAVEKGAGADFNFIPYKGSAPSQNAAMTGEVSVVVTSLAEQQQLLRGGKLRALGMLIPDAFEVEGLGAIPSSFDAYPGLSEYLPISQAIGFAVPADAPDKAKAVLVARLQQGHGHGQGQNVGQRELLPAFGENRG